MTEGTLTPNALLMTATNEDALEAAVREHARLVYRIAYSVSRNHHDAEDATQETFLRILRYRRKLQGIDDPKMWIARIAWRVAVGQEKKRPAGGLGEKEVGGRDFAFAGWRAVDRGIGRECRNGEDPRVIDQSLAGTAEGCNHLVDRWGVAAERGRKGARNKRGFGAFKVISCEADFEEQAQGFGSATWDYKIKIKIKIKDKDRLDDLLEEALKRYGDVEPRPGIEARVLANLAAHRERRLTSSTWMWALPGAGALLVAVALWLGHSSHEIAPRPAPVREEKAVARPLPEALPSISAKARHARGTRAAVKVAQEAEAKLPQFPSPRPMGQQELLLLEYVQHYPDEAMLVAEQQDQFQAAVEKAEQQIQRSSNSEER